MEWLLLNGICVNLIGIYCFWSYVQLRNEMLLISSIHYVTKLIGQIQSVLSGDRRDSREGKKWVQGTVTCHQQPRPLNCGVPSECLKVRSHMRGRAGAGAGGKLSSTQIITCVHTCAVAERRRSGSKNRSTRNGSNTQFTAPASKPRTPNHHCPQEMADPPASAPRVVWTYPR